MSINTNHTHFSYLPGERFFPTQSDKEAASKALKKELDKSHHERIAIIDRCLESLRGIEVSPNPSNPNNLPPPPVDWLEQGKVTKTVQFKDPVAKISFFARN